MENTMKSHIIQYFNLFFGESKKSTQFWCHSSTSDSTETDTTSILPPISLKTLLIQKYHRNTNLTPHLDIMMGMTYEEFKSSSDLRWVIHSKFYLMQQLCE